MGDHVNWAIIEGRLPMVSGRLLLRPLRNTLLLLLLPLRLLHLLCEATRGNSLLLLPLLHMRWWNGIGALFLPLLLSNLL